VSAVQVQLSKAASEQRAYLVAYFDGFNLWSRANEKNADYPHQFLSISQEFFVGTDGQATEIRQDPQTPTRTAISVTGNPSLATWKSFADDSQACRALRHKLFPQLRDATPLFLFFGGYGGAEYNSTLRLFASVVRASNGTATYALSQHPGQGVNRDIEPAIFAQEGVEQEVLIIPQHISSPQVRVLHAGAASSCYYRCSLLALLLLLTQVAVISNGSFSQDSTCSVQSISVGVPSAFLQVGHSAELALVDNVDVSTQAPPYHYDNIATITIPPLTPIANTTDKVLLLLVYSFASIHLLTFPFQAVDVLDIFQAEHYKFDTTRLSEMGIPLNGTELTVMRLLQLRGLSPAGVVSRSRSRSAAGAGAGAGAGEGC
jgi:hypothetical protein